MLALRAVKSAPFKPVELQVAFWLRVPFSAVCLRPLQMVLGDTSRTTAIDLMVMRDPIAMSKYSAISAACFSLQRFSGFAVCLFSSCFPVVQLVINRRHQHPQGMVFQSDPQTYQVWLTLRPMTIDGQFLTDERSAFSQLQ